MPKKSSQRYLQFPPVNPTDETDLICVNFKIPNRSEYKVIIRGLLKELGIWGAWERDDDKRGTEVAEMFRRLVYTTLNFDEDCDGMNCNEVIDCFEDELDNQDFVDKINQALITNTGNDSSPYFPFVKGNRLPSSVINSAVTPATCTNDIMYGASISTINNLADIVLDWVERFETADDGFQIIGQLVDTIPAIGAAADELVVADIVEFAGLIIEQFIDQYRAGDTLELRTELACILFCNTKDACAITMQDIYDAITEYNFIDVLDQWQVVELISSITTGTLPDDKLFVGFLQLAVMSFFASNFFSGQLGGESFLKGIILEGFDEPSSDWELLCEDCDDLCAEITNWDFRNSSTGASVSTTGLIEYLGNNKYRMTTFKDDIGNNNLYVFRSDNSSFTLNFREVISGQSFLFLGADSVYPTSGGQQPTQEQNNDIRGFYWAWSNSSGEPPYIVEFFACPL